MSQEYKELNISDLEPYQWYKTGMGEPGRYVAVTNFKWVNVAPIALLIHKYVTETVEGRYEMKVTIESFYQSISVRKIKLGEKKYIKRAFKTSKMEVVGMLLYYIFRGN